MAIDRCKYSFQQLSCEVLPAHMRLMRKAMRNPVALTQFAAKGAGPVAFLQHIGQKEDFPGCYVLIYRSRPVYIGISRGVAARVFQHIKGRTHYDASLAFRMARDEYDPGGQRRHLIQNRKFREVFDRKQKYLSRCLIAAIRIDNALERYLFEAYCAMKLNTSKWNTFETH